MMEKQSSNVIIDPRSFERVEELVKDTARGGPEYCGNNHVYYHPYIGYILWDFAREQVTNNPVRCSPGTGGRQGIWHTHPHGLCQASYTDYNTMRGDARSAVMGVVPGIPPVNLILTLKENRLCAKAYLPTWSVDYNVKAHRLPYIMESAEPLFNSITGKKVPIADYYGIKVEKKIDHLTGEDYYTITVVGELDADMITTGEITGVYVGAHVPPHVQDLLMAFMSKYTKDFWFYHELRGLSYIEVLKAEPEVRETSTVIMPFEMGREKRIRLLEQRHGFPLEKLRGKTAAVFGAGFLGSRLVEALTHYIDNLIIVDMDRVEAENLGYHPLYSLESLGEYKVHAATKEILKRNRSIRVLPIRTIVPDSMNGFNAIVEQVVKSSDVVLTVFDTIEPRLTIQLAASKHRKPLIDLAVGVFDGIIRIWHPKAASACIGCYLIHKPTGTAERAQYASFPHLAQILVGQAVQETLNILQGTTPAHNIITIAMKDRQIIIEKEKIEEDPECPYHRQYCTLTIHITSTMIPLKTVKITIQETPWEKTGKVIEFLRKLTHSKATLKAVHKTHETPIEDTTISWTCNLQKLGYKLTLEIPNSNTPPNTTSTK